MAKELSPEQEYELVDFLKRWGIDHPELLAEMKDHYTEKALESMASGTSWEGVLDSWKTKETFRSLRKIQKDYENVSPSRIHRLQWEVAKSVLFNWKKSLLFVFLLVFLVFIWTFEWGGIVLHNLFIAKSCFTVAVILYALINPKVRRIISLRNFGFYIIANSLIWQVGFGSFLRVTTTDWLFQPADIPEVTALWASIVLDVVVYSLWLHTKADTKHLTEQILKEYIPKPYQKN